MSIGAIEIQESLQDYKFNKKIIIEKKLLIMF